MGEIIPLFGIHGDESSDRAALEVLRSGQIATGRYVKQFADSFGELTGQKNVVTVNDMSSAIQIALRLIGVGSGDEVLAAAFACMSTNAPIASSGATAVWVDIDPQTGTIDPVDLERSITPRSKAVIVYHLAGYPADIQRIADICKKYQLKLIEDCDNALLATVNGKQVGSFGDFAVYSFYPNRQINATEGGALCCRNAEDAERAIRLRRYGIDLQRFRLTNGEIDPSCDIPEVGWAATLNNLCSAIGYSQLGGVENRIFRAQQVAMRLSNELSQTRGLEIVAPLHFSVPVYWVFLIRLDNRDQVMSRLKGHGLQVSKLHQRTDIYSGFHVKARDLPNTKIFNDQVLALPCGWWLNEYQVNRLINLIQTECT